MSTTTRKKTIEVRMDTERNTPRNKVRSDNRDIEKGRDIDYVAHIERKVKNGRRRERIRKGQKRVERRDKLTETGQKIQNRKDFRNEKPIREKNTRRRRGNSSQRQRKDKKKKKTNKVSGSETGGRQQKGGIPNRENKVRVRRGKDVDRRRIA